MLESGIPERVFFIEELTSELLLKHQALAGLQSYIKKCCLFM
jgi:hypothetical protein